MFGFKWLGDILGAVSKPVTTMVTGWQDRKAAKLQNELLIATAQTAATIDRIKTQQQGDIAWEQKSLDNSGWKDEWFTIILSIPAVLSFCGPQAAQWVRDGFAALAICPGWYHAMFSLAVGSSFGYRKITDFMKLKKGI